MASARGEALQKSERAQLDWVCSRSPGKGDHFAGEFGAERVFTDWEKALAETGTEAVIVTTPNSLHEQMGVAALEAGKDVLMEYPLAPTEEEAQNLIDAAERNRAVLHPGLTYRLAGKTNRIKGAVEGLGQVGFCRSLQCSGRDISRWFDDRNLLGNVFVGSNIHFLDEMIYWFGEVRWVEGGLYEEGRGGKIERDVGSVMLSFLEGPLAQVTYARGWASPGLGFGMEIIGRGGYLVDDGKRLILKSPAGEEELSYPQVNSVLKDTRAFLDLISAGTQPPYTAEEARYAVRVAGAANRSAREGKRIEI